VIPYFEQPKLHLGPLTIHAFGALVATGILLAFRLIRKRAPQHGLDPVLSEKLAMRIVIVAFIVAHVFDRIAYYPRDVLANPLSLIYIWQSISSFGGFIGAVIVAFLFMRTQPALKGWAYLDLIASVFPVGWMFGRMGCTVAYDHPGVQTSFFLGQRYSDHVVRHNLGLYEAIYTVAIVVLFQVLSRRKSRLPGFYLGLLPLVYAPVRFALDFLRIEDARYFGLTPGQYGSVALVAAGLLVFRHGKKLAASAQ
jgi:phosphatidylglycerol---prolipoprotein diacylglyceryl transferase